MNKLSNNLENKELLKEVEKLIDNNKEQREANAFLGFCSRLLHIKPQTNNNFYNSLKHELVAKHNSYNKKVCHFSAQNTDAFYNIFNNLTNLIMNNTKKIITGSILATAILIVVIFSQIQTTLSVSAKEVLQNAQANLNNQGRYFILTQRLTTETSQNQENCVLIKNGDIETGDYRSELTCDGQTKIEFARIGNKFYSNQTIDDLVITTLNINYQNTDSVKMLFTENESAVTITSNEATINSVNTEANKDSEIKIHFSEDESAIIKFSSIRKLLTDLQDDPNVTFLKNEEFNGQETYGFQLQQTSKNTSSIATLYVKKDDYSYLGSKNILKNNNGMNYTSKSVVENLQYSNNNQISANDLNEIGTFADDEIVEPALMKQFVNPPIF